MWQLRMQSAPVVATVATEAARRAPVGPCPSCGDRRERRGRGLREVVGLCGAVALQRHGVRYLGRGTNGYPAGEPYQPRSGIPRQTLK